MDISGLFAEWRGVVVNDGHYLLANGNHSPGWVYLDRISYDASFVINIGQALHAKVKTAVDSGLISHLHGVIGPRSFGQDLTLAVASRTQWRRIWCEVASGVAFWPVGRESDFKNWIPGENFVVVDGVLNTGQTILAVKKLIEDNHGRVVAVAVVVDRSGGKVTAESLGVQQLISLTQVNIPEYEPDYCPICADGKWLNAP
jgi:orotate phosphoribosyltransferase